MTSNISPKTQAQIDRMVADGKIAIVAYNDDTQTPAVLVDKYDRQGRAIRATIEIKQTTQTPAARQKEARQQAELLRQLDQRDAEIAAEMQQLMPDAAPAEIAALLDSTFDIETAAEQEQEHTAPLPAPPIAARKITRAETSARNKLDHAHARMEEAQRLYYAAMDEFETIQNAAITEWERHASSTNAIKT